MFFLVFRWMFYAFLESYMARISKKYPPSIPQPAKNSYPCRLSLCRTPCRCPCIEVALLILLTIVVSSCCFVPPYDLTTYRGDQRRTEIRYRFCPLFVLKFGITRLLLFSPIMHFPAAVLVLHELRGFYVAYGYFPVFFFGIFAFPSSCCFPVLFMGPLKSLLSLWKPVNCWCPEWRVFLVTPVTPNNYPSERPQW